MNNICIAGRSPQVDVVIREEFVSRNQLQFIFTHDGWIVENLVKARKMEINDKVYKAGKKILLDSGDVIKIGMETKLLFVSPEDDPAEVLMAYRGAHPTAVPVEAPADAPAPTPVTKPAKPYIDLDAQPTEFIEIPTEQTSETKPEKELTEHDQAAAAASRKKKLYMILGGAWVGIILVIALALSTVTKNGPAKTGGLSEWPAEKIRAAFSSKLETSHKPGQDQIEIERADSLFAIRGSQRQNYYKTLCHYRAAMAHRVGQAVPLPSRQEQRYRTVLQELTDIITEEYKTMIQRERNKSWLDAKYSANLILMDYIPRKTVLEFRDEEVDKFISNIFKHLNRISTKIGPK
ncbi:MAG: FHA domain-containing protein [Phycisphaerales bacterium]|jgi:hypothetical protein|nr:FHA domain-containing protein [Phycisphaerales bacterium]